MEEELLILQWVETIALVATLAIVVWYTVETHRLRKSSEEQLGFLKTQVGIEKARHEAELDRQQAQYDIIERKPGIRLGPALPA